MDCVRVVLALLFVLVPCRSFAAGSDGLASGPHAIEPQAADAKRVVESVNAERASRFLRPLQNDAHLAALALAHAVDMARRNYFAHETPERVSTFARFSRANITYRWAGENLALDATPDAAVEELWNSQEHRENTLEPHFARVGVGVVATPEGEIFVEDFSD